MMMMMMMMMTKDLYKLTIIHCFFVTDGSSYHPQNPIGLIMQHHIAVKSLHD